MHYLPADWDLDFGDHPAKEPETVADSRPPASCRLPGTREILCAKCKWWYYLPVNDPELERSRYLCKSCERVSD